MSDMDGSARNYVLTAFLEARTAVLEDLALGERDSALLDLVETVFLARLYDDEASLDELLRRGGDDLTEVRARIICR
jgi:hypothetical protein